MSTITLEDKIDFLRDEVAKLTCFVKGKKQGPIMSTAEAAAVFGMRPQYWREQHVHTGNIAPLKGKTALFHRRDVMRLKERIYKLKEIT